jgi:Predicted dehydrogenase
MLIDFCNANSIPYEICGKIIVATSDEEIPRLDALYQRGIENGLNKIGYIEGNKLKDYEPYVSGVKGIDVPYTGIVDYKVVSEKIAGIIRNKGVEIKLKEELINLKVKDAVVEIISDKDTYTANFVVTCAGLQSDRVAKMTNKSIGIKIVPFRGEYYKIKYAKRSLVKNLIYPVPDPRFPFLGVHFTRRIDGDIEAGPNAVFAFKREGYKKSDFDLKDIADTIFWDGFLRIAWKYWQTGFSELYRSIFKSAFVNSLRKLIPVIQSDDLEPGGAGVRAQACDDKGNLIDDFLFIENQRVIHICNAPSPAATSCFSIGDTIADKALERF